MERRTNRKKVGKVQRACCTIVAALTAATLATMLAGCVGSGAGETVPGAYGIDPSSIEITGEEATDCCVVVSAAQGQAFRLPSSALAYAKCAIENEGYASIARYGEVVGKTYALSMSSDSGRKKEADANELDFFSCACRTRATEEGVDLLATMNAGAGDLRARATGQKMVMTVVSSGVSDRGLLECSPELLAMSTTDIVSQLNSCGAIASYANITVRFYGLGQSTGEQVIPSSSAARLQNLLVAIVEAGGGSAVVCTDFLTPLGIDDELPTVRTIDFGTDRLSIPVLASGESTSVNLDQYALPFQGDSTEFADPTSGALLADLADDIVSAGYTIKITGFTADTGNGPESGLDLSEGRARAVADALVKLGVPASRITEVSGMGAANSTSYDYLSCTFDEEQAALDRRVTLEVFG